MKQQKEIVKMNYNISLAICENCHRIKRTSTYLSDFTYLVEYIDYMNKVSRCCHKPNYIIFI